MNNKAGPPVEGNDFFGRQIELDYVWHLLENENNLILPSPRRVGKTSFALKLLAKAKKENWDTIALNMEKNPTETKFIEDFIEQLTKLSTWEKVKSNGNYILENIKKLKPKIKYEGVELALEFEAKKADIYKNLFDVFTHNKKTLVFIDELTVLLNNILINGGDNGKQHVTDFLDLLRSIRQVAGSKIRWIFCSSVDIENFALKNNLSFTINDTLDYKLKPFNEEDSKNMLKELATSNKLIISEAVLMAIIKKLEYCQPFFLQLMFEKIKSLNFIEQLAINEALVVKAYEELITEKHFNTWVERIEEQYGIEQTTAFIVLKHLSKVKKAKRPTLLNQMVAAGIDIQVAENKLSKMLHMLINDGYLMEENGWYKFRSPLLRDFWYKRFEL